MAGVMAIGGGLVSGRTNIHNEFTVYTNRGGYGGLSVGIDGPSRALISYHDNQDGSVRVQYLPKVGGEYKINLKYDGISIKGSPYTVRVRGDEPRNNVSSNTSSYGKSKLGLKYNESGRVRVFGRGLYSAIKNVQNEIDINVKDAGPGRLHWSIEGPGHVESKNRTCEEGVYRLFYKPDAAGEYTIKIRYADVEVQGSPFKVWVN